MDLAQLCGPPSALPHPTPSPCLVLTSDAGFSPELYLKPLSG